MKGKYHITVQNAYVKFQFDIEHNYSIVRGKSATGKTTLVDMIRDWETMGTERSGITITTDRECQCHALDERYWKEELGKLHHNIIFIDEGNEFLITKDFAQAVRHTDNYYVIFTRSSLPQLPYSVDAIYEIRNSGRYGKLKKTYNNFHRLYTDRLSANASVTKDDVEVVLAEDNKSGFQFWAYLAKEGKIRCISSEGKTKVYKCIMQLRTNKALIVADGAAFGSEMEKIHLYMEQHPGSIFLYLPESFEWILLKAEFSGNHEIDEILAAPCEYVDSSKYDSWEQFFYHLLVEKTRNTYRKYQKNTLNPYYLQDVQIARVRKVLEEDHVRI